MSLAFLNRCMKYKLKSFHLNEDIIVDSHQCEQEAFLDLTLPRIRSSVLCFLGDKSKSGVFGNEGLGLDAVL